MRAIGETKSIAFGKKRRLVAPSRALHDLNTLGFDLYANLSSNCAVHAGPAGSFISIAATLTSFTRQYVAGFFLAGRAGPSAPTRGRIEHAPKPDISCVRGASDATAS